MNNPLAAAFQENLSIFVETLEIYLPVAVGLAAFVGLAVMASFTLVRGH